VVEQGSRAERQVRQGQIGDQGVAQEEEPKERMDRETPWAPRHLWSGDGHRRAPSDQEDGDDGDSEAVAEPGWSPSGARLDRLIAE